MNIKHQKPLVTVFHSIHIELNCDQENDMKPKMSDISVLDTHNWLDESWVHQYVILYGIVS